ncbi:hypothetical protein EYR36_000058 [Pleurotus pulmonarius]|nr:hypothetical protein EYR36_000058 [Pleurotus pulmonarius]
MDFVDSLFSPHQVFKPILGLITQWSREHAHDDLELKLVLAIYQKIYTASDDSSSTELDRAPWFAFDTLSSSYTAVAPPRPSPFVPVALLRATQPKRHPSGQISSSFRTNCEHERRRERTRRPGLSTRIERSEGAITSSSVKLSPASVREGFVVGCRSILSNLNQTCPSVIVVLRPPRNDDALDTHVLVREAGCDSVQLPSDRATSVLDSSLTDDRQSATTAQNLELLKKQVSEHERRRGRTRAPWTLDLIRIERCRLSSALARAGPVVHVAAKFETHRERERVTYSQVVVVRAPRNADMFDTQNFAPGLKLWLDLKQTCP